MGSVTNAGFALGAISIVANTSKGCVCSTPELGGWDKLGPLLTAFNIPSFAVIVDVSSSHFITESRAEDFEA